MLRDSGTRSVTAPPTTRLGAAPRSRCFRACGGHVYGLFNNGAYGQPGAVEDLTWDVLRRSCAPTCWGWHELTRLLIPGMRAPAGQGRIIQNSSVLGLVAMPSAAPTTARNLHSKGSPIRCAWNSTAVVSRSALSSRDRSAAVSVKTPFACSGRTSMRTTACRDSYRAMAARLEHEGPTTSFTLPPEAVLEGHPRAGEQETACTLCGHDTNPCLWRVATRPGYPTTRLAVAQDIRRRQPATRRRQAEVSADSTFAWHFGSSCRAPGAPDQDHALQPEQHPGPCREGM